MNMNIKMNAWNTFQSRAEFALRLPPERRVLCTSTCLNVINICSTIFFYVYMPTVIKRFPRRKAPERASHQQVIVHAHTSYAGIYNRTIGGHVVCGRRSRGNMPNEHFPVPSSRLRFFERVYPAVVLECLATYPPSVHVGASVSLVLYFEVVCTSRVHGSRDCRLESTTVTTYTSCIKKQHRPTEGRPRAQDHNLLKRG